jgi:hypothetical protein
MPDCRLPAGSSLQRWRLTANGDCNSRGEAGKWRITRSQQLKPGPSRGPALNHHTTPTGTLPAVASLCTSVFCRGLRSGSRGNVSGRIFRNHLAVTTTVAATTVAATTVAATTVAATTVAAATIGRCFFTSAVTLATTIARTTTATLAFARAAAAALLGLELGEETATLVEQAGVGIALNAEAGNAGNHNNQSDPKQVFATHLIPPKNIDPSQFLPGGTTRLASFVLSGLMHRFSADPCRTVLRRFRNRLHGRSSTVMPNCLIPCRRSILGSIASCECFQAIRS